jgi:hypothetical protein
MAIRFLFNPNLLRLALGLGRVGVFVKISKVLNVLIYNATRKSLKSEPVYNPIFFPLSNGIYFIKTDFGIV